MDAIPYGQGFPRQETKLMKILQDLNTVKFAESRPVQPRDILTPPAVTFKEYKCQKCGCNSFTLIPIPMVSISYGKTVNLRCNRCRSTVNSGLVKEQIQKQVKLT